MRVHHLLPFSIVFVSAVAVAQTAPTRSGLTFEADIGVGAIRVSPSGGDSATSKLALGGLDLGLGGFLTNRLALTLRIAGVTYQPGDGISLVSSFLGPSIQYWISDSLWIGGGAGLAVVGVLQSSNASTIASEGGFGLDLRVGLALSRSWNISFESNPGFFSDGQSQAAAFLIGYQAL